jgi:putative FmdB family regulatory protein
MPTYDYRCTACSTVTEIVRPAKDDTPVPCPACGEVTKQVFHPVGVHFKGGGFHNTDYRPKVTETAEAAPCTVAGTKPACESCPAAAPPD